MLLDIAAAVAVVGAADEVGRTAVVEMPDPVADDALALDSTYCGGNSTTSAPCAV